MSLRGQFKTGGVLNYEVLRLCSWQGMLLKVMAGVIGVKMVWNKVGERRPRWKSCKIPPLRFRWTPKIFIFGNSCVSGLYSAWLQSFIFVCHNMRQRSAWDPANLLDHQDDKARYQWTPYVSKCDVGYVVRGQPHSWCLQGAQCCGIAHVTLTCPAKYSRPLVSLLWYFPDKLML